LLPSNVTNRTSLNGADAKVSGIISSVSVLASLAVQLLVASLLRRQSNNKNQRQRWNIHWTVVTGFFASAALAAMYFVQSLVSWSIMFCLLVSAISVSSSLLQAFVVDATLIEERSVVGWASAIFQTVGSLLGSLVISLVDVNTFLLFSTLVLFLQLVVSAISAWSILKQNNLEDNGGISGSGSSDNDNSIGFNGRSHLLPVEVKVKEAETEVEVEVEEEEEEEGNPLLLVIEHSAEKKFLTPSLRSSMAAMATTVCGRRLPINVVKLFASRFFYECALSATMVNLYLLEALTGAADTITAKKWSMYSSWVDTFWVVVVSIFAAKTSDKVGRKPIIYCSCVLYFVAFIGWPLCRGLPSYLLVGCFFGVAHGAQKSVDMTLMMDTVAVAAAAVTKRRSMVEVRPHAATNRESVARMVLLWGVSGTVGRAFGDWIFGYLWSLGGDNKSTAVATSYAALLQYTLPACILFGATAVSVWAMHVEEDAAEKITVTGGFFDGTPNGYIGIVTVWRQRFGGSVTKLTFNMVQECVPKLFPVDNKGFGGGCWYRGDLWVCWPNRVVALRPGEKDGDEWQICRVIDDLNFNDLHHVDVCDRGIFVANTGSETVDTFSHEGRLQSRRWLVKIKEEDEQQYNIKDLRDSAAHKERRGNDILHVNYVHASDGGMGAVFATCLKTGQVISFDDSSQEVHDHHVHVNKHGGSKLRVDLPGDAPRPHEGFLQVVDKVSRNQLLLWNSTVDGHVVASDPDSGAVVRSWDLQNLSGPRGWHRGLVLLKDGFLVGSTAVREADAVSWTRWRFNVSESRTGVTYVPYTNMNRDTGSTNEQGGKEKSISFLTERSGKVFSLLNMP
jgi:MFS family permease